MFATMRRKRRNAIMKQELGHGVDHFKRAATIAAHETTATVAPKLNAAMDKVQPAVSQARDAASSGWDTAVATLTPLITAATDNVRQAGQKTVKVSKRQAKANKKLADTVEKRAGKALRRKAGRRRARRLFGLAVVGAAVGAGAAYVVRKRAAAQWDEYNPAPPIAAEDERGADDAAFEPADAATDTPAAAVPTKPAPAKPAPAKPAPAKPAPAADTPAADTPAATDSAVSTEKN